MFRRPARQRGLKLQMGQRIKVNTQSYKVAATAQDTQDCRRKLSSKHSIFSHIIVAGAFEGNPPLHWCPDRCIYLTKLQDVACKETQQPKPDMTPICLYILACYTYYLHVSDMIRIDTYYIVACIRKPNCHMAEAVKIRFTGQGYLERKVCDEDTLHDWGCMSNTALKLPHSCSTLRSRIRARCQHLHQSRPHSQLACQPEETPGHLRTRSVASACALQCCAAWPWRPRPDPEATNA